ncbi:hypothetical protein ACJX0J_023219, partial [Zea mays]
ILLVNTTTMQIYYEAQIKHTEDQKKQDRRLKYIPEEEKGRKAYFIIRVHERSLAFPNNPCHNMKRKMIIVFIILPATRWGWRKQSINCTGAVLQ